MASRPSLRPYSKTALGLAIALTASVGGCLVGAAGIVPPTTKLYFPTAVVVSPGRTTLYVANSDFDLQFNGGTVQAMQLSGPGGLRTAARAVATSLANDPTNPSAACATIGQKPNNQIFLYPGQCTPIPSEHFVRKFATTGAFASSATILTRSDGQPGARLFVAVRGDPSVTFFDITDDRDPMNPVGPCAAGPNGDTTCLECGGAPSLFRCGSSHLIGTDPFSNPRQLTLPTEPSGIDGIALDSSSGDPLVVSQETTGAASLVVNEWPVANGTAPGPSLEFVLQKIPAGPISVTAIPIPRLAKVASQSVNYQPAFLISHRSAAALTLVRYSDDAHARPARPFITEADTIPLTLSKTGNDQRGMAIDSEARTACENKCVETDLGCMKQCLTIPMPIYVASRSPASLLIGKIETTPVITEGEVSGISEQITIDTLYPLPAGPSVVKMGKIVDGTGKLATRVFVVSFDSRLVISFDPVTQALDAPIATGRGPFGLGIDYGDADDGSGTESYLYIGNFTDSYIGVVDLDQRRATFGSFLVNAGPPTPPREDQSL